MTMIRLPVTRIFVDGSLLPVVNTRYISCRYQLHSCGRGKIQNDLWAYGWVRYCYQGFDTERQTTTLGIKKFLQMDEPIKAIYHWFWINYIITRIFFRKQPANRFDWLIFANASALYFSNHFWSLRAFFYQCIFLNSYRNFYLESDSDSIEKTFSALTLGITNRSS